MSGALSRRAHDRVDAWVHDALRAPSAHPLRQLHALWLTFEPRIGLDEEALDEVRDLLNGGTGRPGEDGELEPVAWASERAAVWRRFASRLPETSQREVAEVTSLTYERLARRDWSTRVKRFRDRLGRPRPGVEPAPAPPPDAHDPPRAARAAPCARTGRACAGGSRDRLVAACIDVLDETRSEATRERMLEALEDVGVTALQPDGEHFSPESHAAVQTARHRRPRRGRHDRRDRAAGLRRPRTVAPKARRGRLPGEPPVASDYGSGPRPPDTERPEIRLRRLEHPQAVVVQGDGLGVRAPGA